ncbi:MAG: hypothetical protein JSS00_14790, partial [Proteobacteria bacterium]|nr:hypothetical protein [Pseudomonadota bacterium]
MSFVQSGLAGLGRFVLLTSAFCIATIIAITGPPTPSETASVTAAVGHMVRRFDGAAVRFTLGLCNNAPVAAHAAGLCAKPVVVPARSKQPARAVRVSEVAEALPDSAHEMLPPDGFDQIARPSERHARLLGAAPSTHRAVAHVPPPHAGSLRGRAPRAAVRHATYVSAHAHAHAHGHARAHGRSTRPHRAAPPQHLARATPIAAARRPAPALLAVAPRARGSPACAAARTQHAPPPQGVGRAPDEQS